MAFPTPTLLGELLAVSPDFLSSVVNAPRERERLPVAPRMEVAPPAAGEPTPEERASVENSLQRLRAQVAARAATPTPTVTSADPAATQPQQPQQLSVLDMLRKRMVREMEGEDLRNLTDIGIGMLRSSSPNFFTMLAGGLQGQREGQRSRTDQLRQLAELERQDAAQRAEEAYRREQNRLQAERLAAEAPLRSAQAEQALAYRDYLRAGGSAAGRGQLRQADILRIGAEARRFALQQVREPTPNSPEAVADTPEKARLRQEERNRIERAYIQGQYALLGIEPPAAAAGASTANTPAVPTIEVNPVGRPAR